MLDKRLRDLANFFIRERRSSLAVLENYLDLSHRQITYVLDRLNELFRENQISPISYLGRELELTDKQLDFLSQLLTTSQMKNYIMNNGERQKFLYLMLVAVDLDYISLADIVDDLRVSKTTALADLKNLEKCLKVKGITLAYSRDKGYHLLGDELVLRNLLFEWLTKDIEEDNSIIYDVYMSRFKTENVETLVQKIRLLKQSYHLRLVESRMVELAYFIVLILNRLRGGFYQGTDFSEIALSDFEEYHFVQALLKSLDVKSPKESSFLSALVLGESVGDIHFNSPDRAKILELTEAMVTHFQILSGIHFMEWSDIVGQIYSHLRPTYYRLLFHLPINNILVDKVKSEYPSIFYLVERALQETDGLKMFVVPDEELAFLTMHFASILTKNQRKTHHRSIRALVVCTNGVGSSAILFEKLDHLFTEMGLLGPMDMETMMTVADGDFDIIFSTASNASIYHMHKPVFIVNPVMTADEEYRLVKRVYETVGNSYFRLPSVDDLMAIIEKYAIVHNKTSLRQELFQYLSPQLGDSKLLSEKLGLNDVLKQEFVLVLENVSNLHEAVERVAQPLAEKNIIEVSYINQVLENLDRNLQNFLIAPGVLLPHAYPNGVNAIGVGLATLPKPLETALGQISLIIFLAAVDNESHLQVMKDLLKLLSNRPLVDELKRSTSQEKNYHLLQKSLE
ncbi:BglG family transcription antiterminator [Streptococcus tangpeifui]|uniref:BglG family transcription antiterminator n=1 Tax=Streptococcus tangpeifui TaxID=2709400 RepID=UPI0013ECC7C5|nr:BglG family transcription antiterminator [Streptococcus sp. ZJ373]